jgi:hypothetical protein
MATMTADDVYTRSSDQQTDVDGGVNGGDDVTVVFPLRDGRHTCITYPAAGMRIIRDILVVPLRQACPGIQQTRRRLSTNELQEVWFAAKCGDEW